jgi:hypothetical protein
MDGDDAKLTCQLHQEKYSWVGSSADGGYYGFDANTCFAAVSTGAAGTYILDLGADSDFRTDLTIGLGQSVVITGDRNLPAPPTWGTGTFEVKEGGALAMSYVALAGALTGPPRFTDTCTHANDWICADPARPYKSASRRKCDVRTDATECGQDTGPSRVLPIAIDEGARAVALTDCALNFAAESTFAGAGVAAGTSNTCPEVPPTPYIDPNIVYDSADPLHRTAATVGCSGGRNVATAVSGAP